MQATKINSSALKVVFLISAFMAVGCTRLKLEPAKLSIILPSSDLNGASQVLRKNSDLQTQNDKDYGVATPTLSSQLNCYLVFVSGPEENLSANQCQVGTATIPVGLAAGFSPSSSAISMEVDAGVDRVISLVGLQTDGTVACPTLANFDDLKTHFSNPVIVGSVGNIKMLAGATMAVDIPMDKSISANKIIGNCTGPLFNSFKGKDGSGGGNNGNAPAGFKIITQDGSTAFNTTTCVPMQLKMIDSNGYDAGVTSTYTTTLSATGGVLLSNDPACNGASSSLTFTFASFNTNGFFASIPAATTSFQFATVGTVGNTTVTDGALATTYSASSSAGGPYTMNLVDAMTLKTLSSAYSPPLYTCRPYLLQVQDVNHRSYPGASSGSGGTFSVSTGFNYYSDSFCASGVSSFIIPSSSSLMNANVFGTFTLPNTTLTFTPPAMTGTNPSTLSNTAFSVTTPPAPGTATQFGLVHNSMTNLNSSYSMHIRKPTTGCAYAGEIGYFDSAGVRTIVPASGGITFSGNLSAGVLFTNANGSSTYDIASAGSTVLGIGTSNGVTAFKIPLYTCASSPSGNYTMTVSGSSGLAGVIPTTTINFTVGY